MKKTIGILGVAVMAIAMFFNTNITNNANGDFDLASIVNINTANAEDPECPTCDSHWYRFGFWTYVTYNDGSESWSSWECIGWNGDC